MFLNLLPHRGYAARALAAATLLIGSLAAPAANAELTREARRLLDEIPIYFEANEGQTDSQVRFVSRSPEHTLFLTHGEAVLMVPDGVMRMHLEGANPRPDVEGLAPLRSSSAYFIGNRSEDWRTGVAHYGKVAYREVYPGIDLLFYGNGQELEHDFVLAPGADPELIRMRLDGANSIRIGGDGSLRFEVGGSEMHFSAPYAYTENGGHRTQVESRFLIDDGLISFAVGDYDRSQRLVIDPVLSYSTYLGGSNAETGIAVAVDSSGHIIVSGNVGSLDFPTNGPPLQGGGGSQQVCFLTKLDPFAGPGGGLLFSGFFGGANQDEVHDMELDAAGNIYIVGTTFSSDFPTTSNAPQTARPSNNASGFLVKYNLDVEEPLLQYGTYFGGDGHDEALGIAVDAAQRAYVVGLTRSTDIFLSGNPFQGTYRDRSDAFFTLYDTLGGGIIYSTYLGGTDTDFAVDVVTPQDGTVFIAGYTLSGDFPVSGAPFQGGHLGGGDAFLTQINWQQPGSTGLGYSTHIGGTDVDAAQALIADPAGRLHVVGYTLSTDLPTTAAAVQSENRGNADIFVVTLDPTVPGGEGLSYSTYIGGSGGDVPYGVALDSTGGLVLTGYTLSRDFPISGDSYLDQAQGITDAFLLRLDPSAPNGQGLTCSSYFGGSSGDVAYGLAVDNLDNMFLIGSTFSPDFPISPNAFILSQQAPVSAFVSKFGPCATPDTTGTDVAPRPRRGTGKSGYGRTSSGGGPGR